MYVYIYNMYIQMCYTHMHTPNFELNTVFPRRFWDAWDRVGKTSQVFDVGSLMCLLQVCTESVAIFLAIWNPHVAQLTRRWQAECFELAKGRTVMEKDA